MYKKIAKMNTIITATYEELHTEDEDEDEDWEPDFDSDRKVTNVGLNGYPAGYDTSLTNRY